LSDNANIIDRRSDNGMGGQRVTSVTSPLMFNSSSLGDGMASMTIMNSSNTQTISGIRGPFMSNEGEMYYIVDGKISYIREPIHGVQNYTTTTTTIVPGSPSTNNFSHAIINSTSTHT
jgi:hypothetical protein